jgi:hypothetical protein
MMKVSLRHENDILVLYRAIVVKVIVRGAGGGTTVGVGLMASAKRVALSVRAPRVFLGTC